MNKRGFTLVELLVYMGIVGIVVIIAGQAFRDSTRFEMTSKRMIESNQIAEKLGSLLRDDIAQMGMKSSRVNQNTLYYDEIVANPGVYINDNDHSSFVYSHNYGGKGFDSLMVRFVENDADGHFRRIDQVSWYVKNGSLFRSCLVWGRGPADSLCTKDEGPYVVELAKNVSKFVLTPSMPNESKADTIFGGAFKLIPRVNPAEAVVGLSVNTNELEKSVILSGFVSNYNVSDESSHSSSVKNYHQVFLANAGNASSAWSDCDKFSFTKDVTYELLFTIPYSENASRMFRPGVDHMSVGFKHIRNGHVIDSDIMSETFIFPPETPNGERTHVLRFTPRSNYINALCSFTFAFFSPTVSTGTIEIRDVVIRKSTDGEYRFVKDYVPVDPAHKENVRAFKLDLEIARDGVTGKTEMVIPVPSNGFVAE